MKKSGGTGKTKGKTKAVQAVKHKRREDTGGHTRARKGTNPLVLLVIFPAALAALGYLGWFRYQYGHFPLFATAAQREDVLNKSKVGWEALKDTTLEKWKVTKAQLDKWDKKYSAEYEEYLKNRDQKRRETAFLLDEAPSTSPPPARPAVARQTSVRVAPVVMKPVPAPVPAPVAVPAQPVKPVTPVPTPTPDQPVVPAQPVEPAPGPDTSLPAPAPKPEYDPYQDTNYLGGKTKYDTAFKSAEQGDRSEGEEAIGHYTEAIQLIKSAGVSWQLVADKAAQHDLATEAFTTNIANCQVNEQIWQKNIDAIKAALAAPPPAATPTDTGSVAMGSGGGSFYASHPKWSEGKKNFKEGYDIFTKNVGANTGQDSHTLNKYIDQAVAKFNTAEELWTQAEDEWLKKYPKNGPKADADMIDKAMGESQFYRYACMKMHTFER